VNCVYRWYSQLSQYAQATNRISARAKDVRALLKRAGDPMELLAVGLPKTCGFAELGKRSAKSPVSAFATALKKIIEELGAVDGSLRSEILVILNASFGMRGTAPTSGTTLRTTLGRTRTSSAITS